MRLSLDPLRQFDRRDWAIVGLVTLVTTVLWGLGKAAIAQPENLWPWRGPSQLLGLIALAWMGLGLLAGARSRTLEWMFGGLDRAIRLHRTLGVSAMIILVVHLLLLIPPWSGMGLPIGDLFVPFFSAQARTMDILIYYAFVLLAILAYNKRLAYARWQWIHRANGVLFIVFSVHIVLAPGTIAALTEQADELEAEGFNRQYGIDQEVVAAKLHLKAHFYASPEGWDGLMDGPEMEAFLRAYYRGLAEQNRALSEGRASEQDMEALTRAILPPGERLVLAHLAELSPGEQERAILYLTVGSHNQNYRSFMMDGEVMFLTTYADALNGLVDFIAMTGLCRWVDTQEELDALLPPYGGWQRRFGRWIKIGL